MQFCPRIYWYCYRKKRWPGILDIVVGWAPLRFLCWYIYIFTPPQQCLETVSYSSKAWHCSLVKFYLYSTEIRSLSSVLCELSAAARGSAGLREPWTSRSPPLRESPLAFSPWNCETLRLPPPAPALLPPGLSHTTVNPYEPTKKNQVKRLWT